MRTIIIGAILTVATGFTSWLGLDYLEVRQAVAQNTAQAREHQRQAKERYDELRKQQAEARAEYREDKAYDRQKFEQILQGLGQLQGQRRNE